MNTLTESPPITELAPLPASQRIEALDAVRGFALIGICLMNIEFFNRAIATLGQGMPAGLTGIDWLASYFVAYFVAGKFWTIFSLLFGMGFAVMLTRAESAGRGFLKPYMRRIAALAVFGALHHIFLFAGDILFSYAVAAVFLLVVLYGTWKWMLAAIAVAVGLAFVPGFGPGAGGAAGALAFSGLIALYMRNEKRPLSMSVMSLILLVVGIIGAIAATVMWTHEGRSGRAARPGHGGQRAVPAAVLPRQKIPQPGRRPSVARRRRHLPVLVHDDDDRRPGRLPHPAGAGGRRCRRRRACRRARQGRSAGCGRRQGRSEKAAAKPELTEAQKKAEAAAERAKRLKKRAEEVATENKVMTTGSYVDVVKLRAKHFAEHARGSPASPPS